MVQYKMIAVSVEVKEPAKAENPPRRLPRKSNPGDFVKSLSAALQGNFVIAAPQGVHLIRHFFAPVPLRRESLVRSHRSGNLPRS